MEQSIRKTLYTTLFGLIGLLLLLYVYIEVASRFAFNSDNAAALLEAKAVLSGNVLLHGWYTSLVTFYTTDLPFYVAAVYIKGVDSSLLHVVPAVIFVSLVVVACLIVFRVRQQNRWLALVITFMLIGLPTQSAKWDFFAYSHMVTLLFSLTAILLLTYIVDGRRSLLLYILYTLVMTFGLIGDDLYLFVSTIPILCVSVTRIVLRIDRKTMLGVFSLSILSLILYRISLWIVDAFGGFIFPKAPVHPVPFDGLIFNFKLAFECIQSLTGADFWSQPLVSIGGLSSILHTFGLILIVVSLGLAIVLMAKRFKEVNVVLLVLTTAMLINIGSFVVSAMTQPTLSSQRYLIPFTVYGAILAAYFWTDIFSRHRLVCIGLGVIFLGYLMTFLAVLRIPVPASEPLELSTWLRAHHLSYGYADYWNSSSVTVASNDKIQVRPIYSADEKTVVPCLWMSNSSWYAKSANMTHKTFVILDGTNWYGVNKESVEATLGKPEEFYKVHTKNPDHEGSSSFTVLVWDKSIGL